MNNISMFFDLARLFEERTYGRGLIGAVSTAEQAGIQIVEVKRLDMYYIVTLKASDASVLVDWLNTHTFHIPEEAESVLEDYVGDDYYFVINRINLPNKLNESLTDQDYTCADSIRIDYYYDEEQIDWMIEEQFNWSASCKNASLAAVKLLKQVEMGIATPLEIKFEPDQPYYPMKMSSINEGIGTLFIVSSDFNPSLIK